MKVLKLILLACFLGLFSSCNTVSPNSGYFAMDPAQAEYYRRNTGRIAANDRRIEHEERMSRAHAQAISNRNAPDTKIIIPTTVVY